MLRLQLLATLIGLLQRGAKARHCLVVLMKLLSKLVGAMTNLALHAGLAHQLKRLLVLLGNLPWT